MIRSLTPTPHPRHCHTRAAGHARPARTTRPEALDVFERKRGAANDAPPESREAAAEREVLAFLLGWLDALKSMFTPVTPADEGGRVDAAQAGTAGTAGTAGAPGRAGGAYRGDTKAQPSFGGWAWGSPDPAAISRAGFDWFETGYPDALSPQGYQTLADGGVRAFAYVNMGEYAPDLQSQVGDVPVLKTNPDWGTQIVDVRSPAWQDWLIRRANQAYERGARGIKWDCADVDKSYTDPAEKEQALQAMASVMKTLKQQHPDLKFITNGYHLAQRDPALVDGVEQESILTGRGWGGGMTQWANEELAKLKELHEQYGIPVFLAEYTDPSGATAKSWADEIAGLGFVPYITSDRWNIAGRGLGIEPGWR